MKLLTLIIIIGFSNAKPTLEDRIRILEDRENINDIIDEWIVRLEFKINNNYTDGDLLNNYYLKHWLLESYLRFDGIDIDDLEWINDILKATEPGGEIERLYSFHKSVWSRPLVEIYDDVAFAIFHMTSHYNEGKLSFIGYYSTMTVKCRFIKVYEEWKMQEVIFILDFEWLETYQGYQVVDRMF
uniref:Uncharacterized protein n=1 Tax=Pithovirus LCPAC403 TaxID=2506596 RepID=A0A481ZBM6_9VIRU|nr:MAG: uncharacterized protein LCPAC403_01800 [Pithovirus LCPAC403]